MLLCVQITLKSQYKLPLPAEEDKVYTIADITVKGNEHFSESTIVALSGLKIWDKIRLSDFLIQQSIIRMWKSGYFDDVKINILSFKKHLVYLEIEVREARLLGKVNLEGIAPGNKDKISDKLKPMYGKRFDRVASKKIKHEIVRFYKEHGFYNVHVVSDSIHLRDNNVTDYYITIDKGKKVKLKQLIISGNDMFSDKKLLRVLKDYRVLPKIVRFRQSTIMDEDSDLISKDLVTFYRSEGYRDMRVNKLIIDSLDERGVVCQITIHEGKKYYINNISWEDNHLVSDSVLNKLLEQKKGDVYNLPFIIRQIYGNEDGTDVLSYYQNKSYVFTEFLVQEEFSDDSLVSLIIKVNEGEPAVYGNVSVIGNDRTSDYILLREVSTITGNAFKRKAILASQHAIASLGFIEPSSIKVKPIYNKEEGTVDLRYSVKENPIDEVKLTGSYGGAAGFAGALGLNLYNFSLKDLPRFKQWNPLPTGDGQKLVLEYAANGVNYRAFRSGFVEPWLGGKKPLALSLNFSHSVLDRFDDDDNWLGDFKAMTAQASIQNKLRKLGHFWWMSNSINFTRYNQDNYDSTLCESCISKRLSIDIKLIRNSQRASTFYPYKGSYLQLESRLTSPGTNSINGRGREVEWISYNKWHLDASLYWHLGKNKEDERLQESFLSKPGVVLNLRNHVGLMRTYSGNSRLTTYDRFVLGGSGLSGFIPVLGTEIIGLRGYPEQSISPSDNGGTFFMKQVIELRFPVKLTGRIQAYSHLFVEGGSNVLSGWTLNDYYKSAGLGLRTNLPGLGQIGVDYAYGFDALPGTNPQQWHFTFGYQLR